jgi:excisionase family DNA binding protein
VREVASALRVCTATIYSLCERGKLPHSRIGTVIRISSTDPESILQANLKLGRRENS